MGSTTSGRTPARGAQLRRLAVPGLVLFALAIRAWVAARTPIPERDAATYLWMADGLTVGAPARLWETVFHPLFPALIGALRAAVPSLDPVVAGQVIACGASALAVWPLYRLTDRLFGRRAATAASVCFALGTWFVRHPADVLSEGLFHLLVAGAACVVAGPARARAPAAVGGGLLAALAFGVRPEGATIGAVAVCWLAATGARRAAGWCAVGCAAALLFPLGWAIWGPGFTLTPKAAFVWADGVGAAGGGGLAHYVRHAVRLPGAFVEALGFVVGPAIACGAWIALRGPRRRDAWLLLSPFLIQLAVVPILRSNQRFLSGYGVLLLPFAGLAWVRVAPALDRRRVAALAVLAVFAVDLARLPPARRTARVVEREVGAWLGARLLPGERVVSDMPRLDYFAGVEPGPPREVSAAELEAAAARPAVRFVAWVDGRTPLSTDRLRPLGFAPVALPAELAAAVGQRGIVIVGR